MGDASVLMTKALACSERAAGLVDPPPPGRSIHVRPATSVLVPIDDRVRVEAVSTLPRRPAAALP